MSQAHEERAANEIPHEHDTKAQNSAHKAAALNRVRKAQHTGPERDVYDVEDGVSGASSPTIGSRGLSGRGGCYQPVALHDVFAWKVLPVRKKLKSSTRKKEKLFNHQPAVYLPHIMGTWL